MRTSTIVKLNFLFLGLGLVLYFMYSVNKNGLPQGLQAILGLAQTPHQTRELSWCETRVEGLIRPDSFKIAQVGPAWIVEKQEKTELSFLSVEKWFGEFCKILISPVGPSEIASASFQPELFVKFIKGPIQVLTSTTDGVYQWQGQFFRSKELDQALKKLEELSKVR